MSLEEHVAKANFFPEAVHENLMFGTPEEVVRKLRGYEALGIDSYGFGANLGLPHHLTMRSLELFATEVMPHFTPVETEAVAD
jgi:flavin-dependent trigonelline monooxygenase, oxygenase component